MIVIPYTKAVHGNYIEQLLIERNMDPKLSNDLPAFGLIAFENNEPVALGFIRKIEGPYAMLDSFITNPICSPKDRNKALDLILAKLLSIAKTNGVEKIMAFSKDSHTIERANKHGLVSLYDHLFQIKSLQQ